MFVNTRKCVLHNILARVSESIIYNKIGVYRSPLPEGNYYVEKIVLGMSSWRACSKDKTRLPKRANELDFAISLIQDVIPLDCFTPGSVAIMKTLASHFRNGTRPKSHDPIINEDALKFRDYYYVPRISALATTAIEDMQVPPISSFHPRLRSGIKDANLRLDPHIMSMRSLDLLPDSALIWLAQQILAGRDTVSFSKDVIRLETSAQPALKDLIATYTSALQKWVTQHSKTALYMIASWDKFIESSSQEDWIPPELYEGLGSYNRSCKESLCTHLAYNEATLDSSMSNISYQLWKFRHALEYLEGKRSHMEMLSKHIQEEASRAANTKGLDILEAPVDLFVHWLETVMGDADKVSTLLLLVSSGGFPRSSEAVAMEELGKTGILPKWVAIMGSQSFQKAMQVHCKNIRRGV